MCRSNIYFHACLYIQGLDVTAASIVSLHRQEHRLNHLYDEDMVMTDLIAPGDDLYNISQPAHLGLVTASRFQGYVPLSWTDPWYSSAEYSAHNLDEFYDELFAEVRIIKIDDAGCKFEKDYYNCTAACLDPEYTFRDVSTIRNCVLYPFIADALAREKITKYGRKVATKYGYLSSVDVDVEEIQDVIFNCFNDVDREEEECGNWYSSNDTNV